MWQTIGGKCIYQSPTYEKVYQNFIYRWLTFDSVWVQTLINRRNPQKLGLSYIRQLTLAVKTNPAVTCLLGLGGAGVAHALAPYLGHFELLAVENNPGIIRIAKDYFFTEGLKNLRVIQQDARLFVKESPMTYQHLLVDLFNDHTFPPLCNSDEFFSDCRNLLKPNGVLALNLASMREQWSVFKRVREVFGRTTVSLPVIGTTNLIVLACNSASVNPLLDLLEKNYRIKKLSWDADWGCVAEVT